MKSTNTICNLLIFNFAIFLLILNFTRPLMANISNSNFGECASWNKTDKINKILEIFYSRGKVYRQINLIFPADYLHDYVFVVPDNNSVSRELLINFDARDGCSLGQNTKRSTSDEEKFRVLILLQGNSYLSLESNRPNDLIYLRNDVKDLVDISYYRTNYPRLEQMRYDTYGSKNKSQSLKDRYIFFVSRDTKFRLHTHIRCSTIHFVPFPNCQHKFQFADISVRLTYSMEFLHKWETMEQYSINFLRLSAPKYFESLRAKE